MSIPLIVNGITFNYPQQFDTNWGPTLTSWASAVTSGMLQKAGGTFTLTAETDFGASFGLKALYLKSEDANIASTGFLRMGNANVGLVWRNAANSADLALTVNASNQLTFNGTSIGATTSLTSGHILVGNVSNQPADVAMSGDITITNAGVTAIGSGKVLDANIGSAAAITLSKLASTTGFAWYVANTSGVLSPQAVSASKAVVTDSNGLPTTGNTTSAEVGFVHGVTSAIQTQLNSITGSYLPLTGGTMSGVLNMGSNKIISTAHGTGNGEVATYDQLSIISIPYAKGVKVSWVGNTTNHLVWIDAVLEDASGNKIRNNNSAAIVTLNISSSGVNGLDTGSVAASTFYYVWLISNGTSFNGIYSASSTAPTLPGGYTYSLLVGCVITDGSANIVPSFQAGPYVEYFTPVSIVNDSSNNGTDQTLDLSAWVPPVIAWRALIFTQFTANYSDAATHSNSFFAGLSTGSSFAPQRRLTADSKTPVFGSYSGLINVVNELPSGAMGRWQSLFDTSNLTSFTTTIFAAGYELTNLSIN